MAKGLKFDYDSLSPNLKKLLPYVDAGVDLVFDRYETLATNHLRENAPWKDRTGNARNGLMAKHDATPMVKHELTLYHSMPYGYWLEVRWSGRYAIIGPTMVALAPDLTGDVTVAVAAAIRRLPP